MTFSSMYAKLRRKNLKNYLLLLGCCFFSVLLITAYVTVMRTPTVLQVLPEGGDSRKQMMMIFVLVTIGCAAFTLYASGLFFRSKAKEMGLFYALGASRKQLKGLLYRELAFISVIACGTGALLGAPLAWGIWQLFRKFVVDTQEMLFIFEPKALLLALVFSIFIIIMLFVMGSRFIRRTNIMDILNEARKSEPVPHTPDWYGWGGILLMLLGGILGYMMPSFFIRVLHWYPPDALGLVFYSPLFIGLYMVLLHTVVKGWRRRGNPYRHLISHSMMKFQGRQTVWNMLVMTLLLAGAYFAMFYSPMMATGSMYSYDNRATDYGFHYRLDQNLPDQTEIEALAKAYGVSLRNWREGTAAILGQDGMQYVEEQGKMGITWHHEYQALIGSSTYMSESTFEHLTRERADVEPGTFMSVLFSGGDGSHFITTDQTLLYNMVTGETLKTTFGGYLYNEMLATKVYVLDDGDYAAITQGLTSPWLEQYVFFDDQDTGDLYGFSKALFYEIVDRSGPEVEQSRYWDPVGKMLANDRGEDYAYDNEVNKSTGFEGISYDQRDSIGFRSSWRYMPQFRVLDKADFLKTMAVFLMLFVFIAIVCFAAVIVIGYTRCLTIALNSRQIYEDLKRLGAGQGYLKRQAKGQVKPVFLVPALVGTIAISAFYTLILYFNDGGRLSPSELMGMGICGGMLIVLSLILYGVYRFTYRQTLRQLKIAE